MLSAVEIMLKCVVRLCGLREGVGEVCEFSVCIIRCDTPARNSAFLKVKCLALFLPFSEIYSCIETLLLLQNTGFNIEQCL